MPAELKGEGAMKIETHTANYLAELLGRDRRAVARVLRDVKPDARRGKVEQWKVKSLFDAMLAAELQHAPKGKKSTVDERQLLLRQQRIAKQRQNEIEAGTLVPAAEVEREWTDLFRSVRDAMLAIAARAAQRVPHLSRTDLSEIDREIRAALVEAGTAED
jgi:phage terminase Nu1 subunit (DNA packaging protein)